MTVELREGLRQREMKSRRERGEEKARPTDEANVWESQSPATQDLVEVLVDFEPVAFGSLREKRSGEDQLLGSDTDASIREWRETHGMTPKTKKNSARPRSMRDPITALA